MRPPKICDRFTKFCYSYRYDPLNRITGATDNTNDYNVSNISYDKNGNIQTLNRNGYQGGSTFTDMDILDYDYDSGNKLLKVADTGNKVHGFKDGTNTNDDFEYDINGNLKIDRNKGITSITYNHLNLPEQVNFGSDNIKYVYDAYGVKLKRTSSTGTETLYANGYVYEGGVGNAQLQFFNHPEGYVTPDGQGGYDYVYNYTDHLGSVRLSYTDADNDGNIDPANEIIEENNYYPFGLLMRSATATVSPYGNSAAKRWKFNGKELDNGLNIDTYDFGARNYDPAIGRWMNLDPLAEQMRRHSPYNYAFDNPIFFIDPDGMAPTYNWGAGRYEDEDGNEVSWDTVQKEYGLNSSGEGDCCNDNPVAKMMKRAKNALLHAFGLDIKSASDELDEAQSEEDVASAIAYLKESQENLDTTNENLKDVAEILATIEPTGLTGVYYEYTLGDSNSDKALAVLAIIPFTKLAKGAKVIKFIQAGKKVEALVPSGFKVVKGQYSRGQKVYSNGKLFISPDVDGHNGGIWKAANSLRDLGSKKTRLGTFDGLFQKIGD
ncbi:hypothetical protein EJ994_17345 [Maribacter sp. MJ134]|uniref:toxin C-terminal domain-containing protein n=1 Tax=Maribacter sp. MJ134 TaxID=2496865 RepID=UPI000F842A97|nr:toxin C-terminal domain-containing protein [Maribacter sp. MJ134]AZQ57275.1 hypothetical protein EJ994_00060 [Maribacter sp. MJ134]AZQ60476.1 hypothetical protein EJ994_17345 [Maribacter sp. MJ134]